MTIQSGSTVWGARIELGQADHWQGYELGEPIKSGAAGTVYRIIQRTNPPLVAKVYNGKILDRVRREEGFRQRITALAMERAELMQSLPFAFWPRRILFTDRAPAKDNMPAATLGFTMAALSNTIPLVSFLNDESARVRVTHEDNIYIAQLLADRIVKLHAHPWGFVFGDMSPSNVHVSMDYREVYFIDTDGFQFSYNAPKYSFIPPGLTPGYRARGAQQIVLAGGSLNTRHDEFVLAIFIFQILMAQDGYGGAHPLTASDTSEDDNIAARCFPYSNPAQYPVPHEPLRVYRSFPPDIQLAFTQTFTTAKPYPASEWLKLLSNYRRGLRGKTT